jgi:hypothetical protein
MIKQTIKNFDNVLLSLYWMKDEDETLIGAQKARNKASLSRLRLLSFSRTPLASPSRATSLCSNLDYFCRVFSPPATMSTCRSFLLCSSWSLLILFASFFELFCCFKLCADIMFVVCLVSDLLLPLLFLFRSFSRQSTLNVVTQKDHNICSGFPFFFCFFL